MVIRIDNLEKLEVKNENPEKAGSHSGPGTPSQSGRVGANDG
jgi:hypothetical protein